MLRHQDIAKDLYVVILPGAFKRMFEEVSRRQRIKVRQAVVATKRNEVVVAFLLATLEVERHGWIVVRRFA